MSLHLRSMGWFLVLLPAYAAGAIELTSKEVFIPSSTPGVRINALAY